MIFPVKRVKKELLHVINDLMKQDPFSGAVFMFCNSQRKLLKLIWGGEKQRILHCSENSGEGQMALA